MTDLMTILTSACRDLSQDKGIALLLSGGIDSISVGLALQAAGKNVHAYTMQLEGCSSGDLRTAQLVAHQMGWRHSVISVPTAHIADDFIRLAVEHACHRKVQFECSFPLMYAFPAIEETEIFSGFNADDHYGNTREAILEHDRRRKAGHDARVRQAWFDAYRKSHLDRVRDLDSGDTWGFAQRLASRAGKRLYDPYLDERVEDFFLPLSHEQLAGPTKPLIREALRTQASSFSDAIVPGLTLQKGMGVSDLFKALLANSRVNRFETAYRSISPLCQRWGKEVAANKGRFEIELVSLSAMPRATVRESRLNAYSRKSMNEVHAASATSRFTVGSLFAGGGGSSLGYRLAGGKVLFANEFVPQAAATYRANFPDTIVDQRDIRKILANTDLPGELLSAGGLKIGELDILDGSPPCSEFSISGKGISDQSVPKSYSDVKQRGIATLPFDFVEFAHAVKPKVVIMENVPTLATRATDVLERIKAALRYVDGSRAYFVAHRVLNSVDFGVPQKRRRLFLMGVRKDIAADLGAEEDEDVLRFYPQPNHLPVTVRHALCDLIQTDRDTWPWKTLSMTTDLGPVIRLLPKNPQRLTRLPHIDPTIEGNFTLTRCSWELPAPTFTVVGQSPNGLAGAIHPTEDRKFTVPELKRLTGVPDDFILTGTLAQAAERICRMVPPPLTKAIAESIFQNVLLPLRGARHD
jgi:DNA-cytosine methyltransferase